MKSQSLRKNFLWNSSYQLLLIIAPLVTIPYVSRVLGAAQVGVYSYTYSIANYFVLFATLGMAQYGVRLVAQAGDDRAERSKRFWSAWAAQLCVAVPIFVVYIVYGLINPAGGRLVALLWGLWVLSASLDVSWLFFGVEEFKTPTIRNFITKVGGIVIILSFCKDQGDLWAYVLGISGAYFANALMLLPFIRRYVDFVRPKWVDIRVHFAPNMHLFAPVIAVSLYMSFDKILLGSISGMEQAGYYEYADKIARMPLAIVTALCTVLLPHMTAKLAAGERNSAIGILGKTIWLVLAAAIGVAFGIAAISPELVPVFLGNGYEPCVFIIPMVAVALPFISASNVIGINYMLPTCMDKLYTRSVWVGAVTNVVLCLLLLHPFGAFGAAIATVLTEVSVLAVQCWSVRNEIPLKTYFSEALPFLCVGILMTIIIRAAVNVSLPVLGLGWPILVLEIVAAIIVYGGLSLVWCWKCGRLSEVLALFKRDGRDV